MAKPSKTELAYWIRQANDKNLGETVREWYKEKIRKAGYKI